jgi:hypothetical protein
MSHPRPDTTGATRAADARSRRPWWLWALLALLALAILLFALAQCGNSTDPASTTAPAPSNAPTGSAAAGQGSLTAEGTSLLPVAQGAGPNGELTSQVGKAATAQGVLVQSVPADEGFWVGTSETDRVWVQLSGTDESGYEVQQGDRVDFTGQVTAHDPGFPTQVGVNAAEGADQLDQQAAHIEVAKSQLRRSAT